MNQYEWLASNTEKRMEAIDLEMDACDRRDSATFDTGVRQLRVEMTEHVPKDPSGLWVRFLRRIQRLISAESAEKK